MEVRRESDSCGAGGAGIVLAEPSGVRKILFVCARNRLRSPTAEAIFAGVEGLEVSSAGTAVDAECPISADLLEWADEVFVMERRQRTQIQKKFADLLKMKRVVCLDIPDQYGYMQVELVELLRAKVSPFLRGVL
jgi:predicted protein tyrosine phosphatase